jgi:hypothetical protein
MCSIGAVDVYARSADCSAGNTFAHAMVPVGVLLLVVFFLLFGFAVVFQIKLAVTQMHSFNSLGTSLFSVFRGLLGDMVAPGLSAYAHVL